jgi:histone deacetylase 1/2
MPGAYWVEALSTATHLINRRPCQASGSDTPFQLLFGAPPSYTHLRVFGCLCFPNQSSTAANKLSARSTPCALLGYPADHRGYRCLDL